MERRDFLDPQRLAAVAGQVAGPLPLEPTAPPAVADPDAVILHFARRAMATTFEVILPLGTPGAHELAGRALDEIDRLEQQLTVYRDDSEVSRINARAAEEPVIVEEHLFDLFLRCADLYRET